MIKILYHFKKNRKKIFFIIFLFIFIFTSSYFTNILIEKPNNSLSNEYLQNNIKSRIASDDLIPSGERVTVMNDPRTTTVISWNTKEYPSEPIISYGETESLGIFKEASIYTIQTGYLCSAELTDLKPNTSYYYQVESNSSYKGEIMNFKTAPERNDPTVRFLVWGDSRTDRNTRTILAQKASQLKNFSFTIHTGDIVADGAIQEQWDNYFNDTKKMNAFHQSYFIAGNHEWSGLPSQTLMYDNIPMPSNMRDSTYYSFNYGPISFVGLDTNDQTTTPYITMNLQWLETELKKMEADNYSLWKIAYFHEPIFNSMPGLDRLDREDLKTTWYPLFEQYHLDIMFVGHNHYYERTYPINHTGEFNNSQDPNYINPQYPIQIISAGAGAPLYDTAGCNASYSAYFNSTYHFSIVDIGVNLGDNTTKLTLETWAMKNFTSVNYSDLFLIDKITITKDLPEKYLNITYTPSKIDEFVLKPDWIYYLAYIGVIAAVIIFADLPIFYRYGKKWKKRITEKIINIKDEKFKLFISLTLYILFSIGIYYILVGINLTNQVFINLILSFSASFLLLSIVNGILWQKNGFILTFGLFINSLVFIAILYLFLFEPILFDYNPLFILLFCIIGVGILIGSAYLSRSTKVSKVSHRDFFLLSGNLLLLGNLITILSFIKIVTLII